MLGENFAVASRDRRIHVAVEDEVAAGMASEDEARALQGIILSLELQPRRPRVHGLRQRQRRHQFEMARIQLAALEVRDDAVRRPRRAEAASDFPTCLALAQPIG